MLDQETKKKINDLRDTLVGKVPDPKSQVEQIMIALIYKFMNDMDKESTDLGGEASFFVGDFEKYSWDNLFGTKVSGSELVDLYSTAVESMEENPNIPQLFRDIFKNAFIPYKDAETLRLFLSQINDFEYSKDSEQLGDAFEHILNSLSSQGDAGQFRTPRHIIDFIVEIVDPKKDETVLDPASGTSGFLISAFKHIVQSNTEKSSGDLLSAAERKKIMENINGYDISPDMVRIGLANMYLHGFPEPSVVEYDALTSEDRWNEYYDVILANPPFMTPKGGIRPHNRFGIKSNRAEILFVDYILTHLKPKGRAGIIVPDGIVSTENKTYKELRKKLVENGLEGVVSLPAGIFNPYSGVKTSILFVNKGSQSKRIFFEKINNDGFDLGAKRNPIDKNDIPKVFETITKQKFNPENYIKKSKILEHSDISLTFNSYTKSEIKNSDWDVYNLMDLVNVLTPIRKLNKGGYKTTGSYPIVDQSEKFIAGYSNNDGYLTKLNKEVVVFGDHTKKVKYIDFDFIAGADGIKILEAKENLNSKFLYYFLKNTKLENLGYSRHFKLLKKVEIPLPPLEKQQEIVNEVEQYQKVIDGASQVVESYKTSLQFEESATKFKKYSLLEISEFIRGVTYSSKDVQNNLDGKIVLRANNINLKLNKLVFEDLVSVDSKLKFRDNQKLVKNDILICTASGSKDHIGKVAFSNENTEYYFGGFMGVIRAKNIVLPKYLFGILASEQFNTYLKKSISGASINNISKKILENYFVDIPDIETQKQVVEILNIEQKAVEANIKLIDSFENKISLKISSLYSN